MNVKGLQWTGEGRGGGLTFYGLFTGLIAAASWTCLRGLWSVGEGRGGGGGGGGVEGGGGGYLRLECLQRNINQRNVIRTFRLRLRKIPYRQFQWSKETTREAKARGECTVMSAQIETGAVGWTQSGGPFHFDVRGQG